MRMILLMLNLQKRNGKLKLDDFNLGTKNNKVNKEVIVYTEDDHTSKMTDGGKELYEKLKDAILELGDIDIDVKKMYIAFKGRTNIADVSLQKNRIKIFINMKKGTLKDPYKLAIDMSKTGHWGNGDYCVDVDKEDDIGAVIPLIRQSIKENGK